MDVNIISLVNNIIILDTREITAAQVIDVVKLHLTLAANSMATHDSADNYVSQTR